MRKFIFLVFTFGSAFGFANEVLKASDFSNLYDDINSVETAERVFTDDFEGVDLYKVSFVFEVYDCASNPSTPTGHSCGLTGELEKVCLYVFHDTHLDELERTKFTCDRDIEDVIPVQLYDGW